MNAWHRVQKKQTSQVQQRSNGSPGWGSVSCPIDFCGVGLAFPKDLALEPFPDLDPKSCNGLSSFPVPESVTYS